MRKFYLLLCVVFLICPTTLFAETVFLELNANSTDVEGKAEFKLPGYETDVRIGGGVLFSRDDYFISNASISIRDDIFLPALNLGLGFKGVYCREDIEHSDDNFNAGAIGFLLLGEYDFRKDATKFPISIATNFTFAPTPLSFADIDQYLDFMIALYIHIVDNAAIVGGYRYYDMSIEGAPDDDSLSYDSAFFGCRISF